MNYIQRFFGHLKTVLTHKYHVFVLCCKAGLIWRGIKHDMSKFSPTEFFESVKYYTGSESPIDKCKRENNGISMAWLHHRGRNTHHYEYWYDNFDNGGTPHQMPFEDALEMVIDYIAAGIVYSKGKGVPFSFANELDWWYAKSRVSKDSMHVQTRMFVHDMMIKMKHDNSTECLKKNIASYIYKKAEKDYKRYIISVNRGDKNG